MGEGSAMIVRNNSSFSALLTLGLRDDDEEVIVNIQRNLGGRFIYNRRVQARNPIHGNQVKWLTSNLGHVLDICNLLLEGALIPAKKLRDVEQVRDFCLWRKSVGFHLTDEDRAEALRRMNLLKQSRVYS